VLALLALIVATSGVAFGAIPAGLQPHVDLGPAILNLAPGASDA
jgi:hypothetical protein